MVSLCAATGHCATDYATDCDGRPPPAPQVVIFEGMGVVKELLDEYLATVAARCPGFPAADQWADSESDGEVGMQLRAVAILLVNGVAPKVFQVPCDPAALTAF
eukprot:1126849-Prorocentrum_minimum.AAC.7